MLVQEVMAAMTTLPCLSESFTYARNVFVHVGIFYADGGRAAAFLLPAGGIPAFAAELRSSRCGCARLRFDQRRQSFVKGLGGLREDHAILRTLGAGETGLNRTEIEREQFGVFGFGSFVVVEKSLLAAVGFDQSDLFVAAAAEFQIFQTFFVDRENAAGSAVFRRHVGDGSAVGERKIAQSRPEVFDKLSHHAMLAQHLGDGQNKISGSSAFAQTSSELHANHQRNQHGNRLPEHRGFSLDSAHAPAKDAQAH